MQWGAGAAGEGTEGINGKKEKYVCRALPYKNAATVGARGSGKEKKG